MASITATWQATPTERVLVSLAAWSADGPVKVYRVHSDGTRWLVRGMPDVSGGVSATYDYEAPPGVFHYEANDGASLIVSANVTGSYPGPVLRVPGQPGIEAEFELLSRPVEARDRPTSMLRPLGRTTAVPRYTAMGSPSFTLEVETHSTVEDEALDRAIEASGVLLLICPELRTPWRYVAVSADQIAPFAPGWAAASSIGQWEQRQLSMAEVGYPTGDVLGDPTASYQAIVDKGWTYQQLLDWKAAGATTYTQVLMGGY